MSDKFWNFSKAERIAAIALTIIIVLVLAISFFARRTNDAVVKDYSAEIEEFKSRVESIEDTIKPVKKRTSKRLRKTYAPNTQKLSPVQKERR